MSALPESPFWMVLGIGQGAPTRMHDDRASAAAEMRRLARRNPGIVFVMLESVGAAVKDDLRTVVYGGRPAGYIATDDEIPF